MSQVWSRVVSVLIQGGLRMKGPPKKLTTQSQKSFESHLSSTLMRVKLVNSSP